jgi:hypothetical protein
MTELLRNFEMRQSWPWIAVEVLETRKNSRWMSEPTSIRDLGDLVAVIDVPK